MNKLVTVNSEKINAILDTISACAGSKPLFSFRGGYHQDENISLTFEMSPVPTSSEVPWPGYLPKMKTVVSVNASGDVMWGDFVHPDDTWGVIDPTPITDLPAQILEILERF